MLSILVTYYNQEKYVSRSLDSIFAQNITEPFEVLIGDDGSQDHTCDIIRQYSEKHPGLIKLFIQDRDFSKVYSSVERASNNRLNLLKHAKGEYVCFLDGDDNYIDNTWLQESIDILDKDKKLAGVAHNYCEKYDNEEIKQIEGLNNIQYITAKKYCRSLYTHVGTILFRNYFTDHDFNKLSFLKSFDDNDITFYFLNFGNLYYVNKVVYNYYQNEGSIWNTTNEIEKYLINAIDYEILKKIIKKYHIQLFLKYNYSIFQVYNFREQLDTEKYEKYKNQCITNSYIHKLIDWNKQSYICKVYLQLHCVFLKFINKIFIKLGF